MRSPAAGPAALMPANSEARLLVVDDEPTILELLAGSLRFAGFDVVTAASGVEALRVVAAARPDLILLDVMMPDGDGFEVIRRLRSGGPRVPVIFLSARGAVHERVTGLVLGGDDYVTKPFSLVEVLARIRAVLRRSGGEAEACSRLVVADLELDEGSHEVRRGGMGGRAPAVRRRCGARRGQPRSAAGRYGHRPDADRVQAPALPDGQRRTRSQQSADPRPRLGSQLQR